MEKIKKRIANTLDKPVTSLGITVLENGWGYRDSNHPTQNNSWNRADYIFVCFLGGKGKLESAKGINACMWR